jgi:hypothetical protein
MTLAPSNARSLNVAACLLSSPATLLVIEQNKNIRQEENTSWSSKRRNCCFEAAMRDVSAMESRIILLSALRRIKHNVVETMLAAVAMALAAAMSAAPATPNHGKGRITNNGGRVSLGRGHPRNDYPL